MSTVSATPAGTQGLRPRPTLVWDAPVRVFHWLLVLGFATAWLTSEGERWRLLHVVAGYTVGGLVAFRIVWGLVGTRPARFTDFVRGPRAIAAYLRSLVRGRPEHHAGHNPAGAVAIVGMLTLAVLTTASGWATDMHLGGEWLEDAHDVLADAFLVLVGLHVAGVIAGSWLHHENLVGSMIDGRKAVPREEGIRRPWRGVAAVLLAAVLAFWWWQWQAAPAGGLLAGPAAHRAEDAGGEDD